MGKAMANCAIPDCFIDGPHTHQSASAVPMTTTKPTSAIDESAEQIAERLLPCWCGATFGTAADAASWAHAQTCPAQRRDDVATALQAERERALEEATRAVKENQTDHDEDHRAQLDCTACAYKRGIRHSLVAIRDLKKGGNK